MLMRPSSVLVPQARDHRPMAEFIAAICVGAGACDSLISICPFFDVLTDVYFYYKYKGYMKQVMLPMIKDYDTSEYDYDASQYTYFSTFPNGMTDQRPKSRSVYDTERNFVGSGLMKEEDLGVLACSCIAAIPEDDWEACCLRQVRSAREERGRTVSLCTLNCLTLTLVRRIAASRRRPGELRISDDDLHLRGVR